MNYTEKVKKGKKKKKKEAMFGASCFSFTLL